MEIVILILLIITLIAISALIIITLLHKQKGNNALSPGDLMLVKQSVLDSYASLVSSLSTNIDIILKREQETTSKALDDLKRQIDDLKNDNNSHQVSNIKLLNEHYSQISDKLGDSIKDLNKIQNDIGEKLNNEFKEIIAILQKNNSEATDKTIKSLNEFNNSMNERLEKIDKQVSNNLDNLRKDNNEKLEKIQNVVDEKLQKTLEERLNHSFQNVLEQITGVNQAIGEIKGLASDVTSLKNVLANVKTKGIVGEVILGNLIREILAPTQYKENYITKAGSSDPVEFAIRIPSEKDEEIYLPIDSKFPTETYTRILEAIEQGDKEAIEDSRKQLKATIKKFAKDIATKYIDEPNTTPFAIMFLPIEGLYAEVINLGLFEELQREYGICICGPSTFAALLNALNMGFKSMVIQKKSAEVFKLLGSIKTEFGNFAEALEKTQNKYEQAGKDLEDLVGKRTRAMNRKLRDVEEVDAITSKEYLGIDEKE